MHASRQREEVISQRLHLFTTRTGWYQGRHHRWPHRTLMPSPCRHHRLAPTVPSRSRHQGGSRRCWTALRPLPCPTKICPCCCCHRRQIRRRNSRLAARNRLHSLILHRRKSPLRTLMMLTALARRHHQTFAVQWLAPRQQRQRRRRPGCCARQSLLCGRTSRLPGHPAPWPPLHRLRKLQWHNSKRVGFG